MTLREQIEALIEAAGGRCVKPADYDPDEINICEAHSEIWIDDGCEDQPRQLLAVLDIIDAHRCIPDRDALARALHDGERDMDPIDRPSCPACLKYADHIIAALEEQADAKD